MKNNILVGGTIAFVAVGGTIALYNYNYCTEAIIYRSMQEWEKSDKGVEDHKRLCKALRTNDASKGFLTSVLAFFDKYRASFGDSLEITEIYSSIELRVYSKDDIIYRRMQEWEKSDKGVEDYRKFCKALTMEIQEGSNNVSKVILSGVQRLGYGIVHGIGYGIVHGIGFGLGVTLWFKSII